MTLYELSEQYTVLLQMIEDGEIPEEAIADTLEAVGGELDAKIDSIACIIKDFIAQAEAIKSEIAKLNERKAKKERDAERLKEYLADKLITLGKLKFESSRNKISFRKSNSVLIEDEGAFIDFAERNGYDAFLTYKAPTINRTEIKAAISEGQKLPGVSVAQKMNIQIK